MNRLHPDELQVMLEQALEEPDVNLADRLHTDLLKHVNHLRKTYGLTLYETPHVVLRSCTQQLEAAGVDHEALLGDAVLHQAPSCNDATCMFPSFFTTPELAADYRARALQIAEERLKVRAVTVYPPLLARSLQADAVNLHLDPSGGVDVRGATNGVLVMFVDGPIVPVLVQNHPHVESVVRVLYALQGVFTAEELVQHVVK